MQLQCASLTIICENSFYLSLESSGSSRPHRQECGNAAMTSTEETGLIGLPYKDHSYFDFVVAEPLPKYIPGSGPPLAPISVLPPDDIDGFIIERSLVEGQLRYLVGYNDRPQLKVTVRAQNILDWVSSRTFEQWESDEYERLQREREKIELPAIIAKDKARRKRLEKISRASAGPKTDGRKKRGIRAVDGSREREEVENGSGKKRRGRPPRSTTSTPNNGPVAPGPGSGRNQPAEPQTFVSPRRVSQASQPSLSTPNHGRDLADLVVLDTDDSGDDDSDDINQALAAQLNGPLDLSESSRSESLDPLTFQGSFLSRPPPAKSKLSFSRDPGSAQTKLSLSHDSGNSTLRRPSLIGGTSSTAATSSREAFSIYESIERKSKLDATLALDRSPFKKPPPMAATPRESKVKSHGTMLPPRSTRSASRQDTPSSFGSVRRSGRKMSAHLPAQFFQALLTKSRSTPPPAAPYVEDEESTDEDEEYEVERLLDDQIRPVEGAESERERWYLVKWVGYDSDQNTWEPAGNVGLEVIRNYEAMKARLHLHGAQDELALRRN